MAGAFRRERLLRTICGLVILALRCAYGFEEYSVSQISPKSVLDDRPHKDIALETSSFVQVEPSKDVYDSEKDEEYTFRMKDGNENEEVIDTLPQDIDKYMVIDESYDGEVFSQERKDDSNSLKNVKDSTAESPKEEEAKVKEISEEEFEKLEDYIARDLNLDERRIRVERSAETFLNAREIRSLDDLSSSRGLNEIESDDIEVHNKRKYYQHIHPTKTSSFLREGDDVILSSEGFGDKFDFHFSGEADGVPRPRALRGPRINPTAVQPTFATVTPRLDNPRQNPEIQNIITGIVKLLNGNVNVQANSQLVNGRPGRPMNSRINNRGPPRISDVPPLPEFDKPTLVPNFHPTKLPPPYPFDRPPHHGDSLVPPGRPTIHRPIPPWQRPRPRPSPSKRPNPNFPLYKPPMSSSYESHEDKRPDDSVSEEELHEINNILHHNPDATLTTTGIEQNDNVTDVNDTKEEITYANTPDTSSSSEIIPVVIINVTTDRAEVDTVSMNTTTEKPTTEQQNSNNLTESSTKSVTTTATQEATTLSNEKITTSKSSSTEKTTTEKAKPDKPSKDKKKDTFEKDKGNKKEEKYKITAEIDKNSTTTKENESNIDEPILETSIKEKIETITTSTTPFPVEGLPIFQDLAQENGHKVQVPINTELSSTASPGGPKPYKPRPGIVLDDPDFKPKPHPTRYQYRPEPSVITANQPYYGEIFNVTVSAIQGLGDAAGPSALIESVPVQGNDDIILSSSGAHGFVSINGERTYLNLFGDASSAPVAPTPVHTHHATPPPGAGIGVALPAGEVPRQTQRPNHTPRPNHYRRPHTTVRIDTCIVGDDSTCDQTQNEMCRTESGISSCQCRPGFARRNLRDPCRRVVAMLLSLRVDRIYDRKVNWDSNLKDKESEPYQLLSQEALRAIDSAFSMTPYSDDFVAGSVNTVFKDESGVFVNYTVLLQESAETLRAGVALDVQRHLLGVIKRRSNNVGASALYVDSPHRAVAPLTDLDECSSAELNDCHPLASCTNTWGGFRCSCPETTRDSFAGQLSKSGRECLTCPASTCSNRGSCLYNNNMPYCSCSAGYYGSACEVDGEVVGVAVGASLSALLVIVITFYCLLAWSRKWSREQKGMGSPVFSYMASTVKAPPVGQPPYQVSLEERMRWAQLAEAMAQANHYAPEPGTMGTRPSSAMFGHYPTATLPHPPVPLPRMGMQMAAMHTGTMNSIASRANNSSQAHLYGYAGHGAGLGHAQGSESTGSEAESHAQERADLIVPRPKSRARNLHLHAHNQTGIYYDVEYENASEAIYGTKGIPLSTYTVSRGPPFYRS